MFAIENYDVQETRREARIEGKIEDAVILVKNLKMTVGEAMRALELPVDEEKKVIEELNKRGITYMLEQ